MFLRIYKLHLLVASVVVALSAAAEEPQAAISATTPQGRIVEVSVINNHTVKVLNKAADEAEKTASRFDLQAVKASSPNIQHVGEADIISTGVVTAILSPATGELVISGGADRVVTDSGLRMRRDGKLMMKLSTTSSGAMYGAGERGHSFDLRGDTLVMYNRPTYGYGNGDERISQMNITMPLFISSDGFALIFDDYAAAEMILGNPIEYITESPEAVSYYFINGVATLADVVEQLSAITGRQDLPPLWALGYITSKYGYRTQQETLDVVDRLKREGYPLDGIVLDLYWYGKEEDMGRLDWDPVQWPEPEKMLSQLDRKGVKTVTISQPYVLRNGRGVENYDSLAPKGIFAMDSTGGPMEVEIWVGKGGMFDVSNPVTQAWLYNRYGQLTDMGVGGLWGDLGEPEKHPDGTIHANGLKARQYHNRYGNEWSAIIHKLYKERYPDRRLMSLMRGGTTGLQTNSVFPWSGDVSRSWAGLQPQVRIMLNTGLSGLGYIHHDVGGFAIDKEHPIDPELYIRWLQLGLFSPMLRTHSQEYAEPYHYPEYSSIIKRLIRERYRWLPYNYTLAYENAVKGWPLVRPITFHGGSTVLRDTVSDEYLWGNEVLVAPVMHQGAVSRRIIFPEGLWLDLSDPRKAYSGTVADYPAPLDVLPVFVKAGAIIPTADYSMDNTADYDPARLTINYFPFRGIKSSYTLFDDNRMTQNTLSSGEYRLIHFAGDCLADGDFSVDISSEGTYTGAPKMITFTFKAEGLDRKPESVTVDGRKIKFKYDDRSGTLAATVMFTPGTATHINTTFHK